MPDVHAQPDGRDGARKLDELGRELEDVGDPWIEVLHRKLDAFSPTGAVRGPQAVDGLLEVQSVAGRFAVPPAADGTSREPHLPLLLVGETRKVSEPSHGVHGHSLVQGVARVQDNEPGAEQGRGAGAATDRLKGIASHGGVPAAEVGKEPRAGAGRVHGQHPPAQEGDPAQEGLVQRVGQLEQRVVAQLGARGVLECPDLLDRPKAGTGRSQLTVKDYW